MTELEAVNKLLSVIGEAPIDKLADISTNEISDASLARKTLHEINRDVQSEGWLWNTEVDVPLSVNKDGEYDLPANALRANFSPNRYPYSQYIVRGLRVYDRMARTYAIGPNNDNAPVVVDHMVLELPWAVFTSFALYSSMFCIASHTKPEPVTPSRGAGLGVSRGAQPQRLCSWAA